ncbi:MAG: hypothetical protein ACRDGW_05825, partial [Actinomycetota bacterium]
MNEAIAVPSRRILLGILVAVSIAASVVVAVRPAHDTAAAACPAGYTSYAELEARERRFGAERERGEEEELAGLCISNKHPESLAELSIMRAERSSIYAAPYGRIPANARANALAEREALAAKQKKTDENSNPWKPVGIGPLQSADEGYDSVNGLGLVELAGRITDFSYDRANDDLYASVATGGVWRSDDQGESWVSIGETLPTQVVGSVAYTPADGGAVLALTGDGSFGANSYEGMGAYRSTDGGQTWVRASGVPNDAFGFKLAVDPTNPSVAYAATGAGLFRSSDAGVSYTNVSLPTGPCEGRSNRDAGCVFANIVTDVVVQAPGGTGDEEGGNVIAAVGWRGGQRENPNGTVQSPNNGIYASATGAPGTFAKVDTTGFTPQERIGRIELGAAIGPDQDHDYLYAIVQDAVYLRGGAPAIDAPETDGLIPNSPTVLDGVYVSSDFGTTWVKMVDGLELQEPTTGSALAVTAQVLGGFGPGVQAWYNDYVLPDPTRQDPLLGIPTRLHFGLEEVWENEVTSVPQNGKSQFKVIGRYFSGETCLFISGLPACPTDRDDVLEETTTTHPDQHAAIFIPQRGGGVKLVVGNDGGVYTQTVGPGDEFQNSNWGVGAQDGFNTLLPYHAAIANDETVWMGMQDNGSAKIQEAPDENGTLQPQRQIMTFGGDGFFVAVDPADSDVAYSETTFADMRATTDGGRTWSGMAPDISNTKFSNPFVMDATDANHLLTAGREVVETTSGPGTGTDGWHEVYDLGTAQHPGDANAAASPADPANSMSAVALHGDAAYVGYCGTCDVLNNPAPFLNGLATNVGGAQPPERMTSNGWHIASANGLPNRYITSIAIDPADPRIVYVTLGGYYRRWTPPGTLDDGSAAGSGHLFKSIDAGETFTDISGALPNTPATWVIQRGQQLLVGTDIGVFAITPNKPRGNNPPTSTVSVLGTGLPNVPISSLMLEPEDPNHLIAATYGRGIYEYRFGPPPPEGEPPPPPPPPPAFLGETVAGPFGFELGDEGWTATTTSDTMFWRRGAPGHVSSTSFQVIPYTDQATATLTSPELSLPADSSVVVDWWQHLNIEEGFDYVSVQWSSDGQAWNAIEGAAFTGLNPDYPDFTQMSVTFVAPAGSLFIRFQLATDQLVSSPPFEGVAIDDVTVLR